MMEPIRVLHNIASLHFGGSQSFVMNVYRNIDRSKIQFDFVVTPEEKRDLYEQVEQMGGRIFVAPKYTGKNHFSYCKWWDDFFIEHPEYHIIHGHVRSTAAIYLKIANRHGLVTIAHSHSTSNGSGIEAMIKDIMQIPIRDTADYLFACSDKAGEWLYGKKAILQKKYKMIPNGIDLKLFAFNEEKRKCIREKLGIAKDTFVVGHVGRFTAPKNHKFLIELFAEYHRINQKSKLLLVGNGDLFETVKQQIIQLEISKDVILVGSKDNTEDYYQAMDVFVFPSLWEGLPVSVVEAQANGLPCLISDVITYDVNLTDLVRYLPLDSKQKWIDCIEETKKMIRHKVSDRNRKCLETFDVKEVAHKLQDFYIEQHNKVAR